MGPLGTIAASFVTGVVPLIGFVGVGCIEALFVDLRAYVVTARGRGELTLGRHALAADG